MSALPAVRTDRLGRPYDPRFSERLRAARAEHARAGRHTSGTVPYGYRRPGYKRRHAPLLEVNPPEAEIVRFIFRMYLRLRSTKRLRGALSEIGSRTRRGKHWSTAGLLWILRNDTYIGRVHFADVHAAGQHAPIVAPVVFYKAGQLLRKNAARIGRTFSGRERVALGTAS